MYSLSGYRDCCFISYHGYYSMLCYYDPGRRAYRNGLGSLSGQGYRGGYRYSTYTANKSNATSTRRPTPDLPLLSPRTRQFGATSKLRLRTPMARDRP